jgi:hypothetical protein
MRSSPKDAFADWAATASQGSSPLHGVLTACVQRFLRRRAVVFMADPAPGWTALARLGRSAAALRSDGTVRSTELFHIPDLAAFAADPNERCFVLDASSWDDRAALFTPFPPPRRTRDPLPTLDWSGDAFLAAMPEHVRQFEYFLNADLQRNTESARILLTAPSSRPSACHRRMIPPVRAAFEEAFLAFHAPTAALVLSQFRNSLDVRVLKAVEDAAANEVRSYNWLLGKGEDAPDSKGSLRRLQAVTAYPIAWPILTAPVGVVADAVRESRPLNPALALEWNVSEATIRRMNGLSAVAASLTHPDAQAAALLAKKVARMPPGAPPKNGNGWSGYLAAVDLAEAVVSLCAVDGVERVLLAPLAGRWDKLENGLLVQAAGGISHMVADLHVNLFGPAARRFGKLNWPLQATANVVLRSRRLTQLAESSAWWHREQMGVRTRLLEAFPFAGRPKGAQSWPPLHPGGPWVAPNGLRIVALTTEDELVDEHKRMQHCVNGYASNCFFGGSHILSVRRDGEPGGFGTIEIRQDAILAEAGTYSEHPDAPLLSLPASVSQFKSFKNTKPPGAAWEALWAYVGAILTGGLKLEKEMLVLSLAERRLMSPAWNKRDHAAYNDKAPGAIEEAWRLYAPALSPSLAKSGITASSLDWSPLPNPMSSASA